MQILQLLYIKSKTLKIMSKFIDNKYTAYQSWVLPCLTKVSESLSIILLEIYASYLTRQL